jgi:hypothetical protein
MTQTPNARGHPPRRAAFAATKGGVRYLANALTTTRSTPPEIAITLSCQSRQALLRPKPLKGSESA